jgi:hypothetical protein
MAVTTSPEPLSFAISYGLMGGPLHAIKLKKQMRQAGFVYTKHIQQASIIIAHSAGCWLIPADSHPKLIMYIGMPLNTANPRQTLKQARALMFKHGTYWSNFKRISISMYYGVRQPKRTLDISRMAKTAKPVILPEVAAVFIVNQADPWPDSQVLDEFLEETPWSFINLPGAHDDIKEHSERYVEIIEHYARLLA